jgi:hypothetical protein
MNDALHVVTLTPSTMEAALDARRLRLVVSMEDATVLSTSPSPDALFGFGPQSLVGMGGCTCREPQPACNFASKNLIAPVVLC